jgi:hypothetical protein
MNKRIAFLAGLAAAVAAWSTVGAAPRLPLDTVVSSGDRLSNAAMFKSVGGLNSYYGALHNPRCNADCIEAAWNKVSATANARVLGLGSAVRIEKVMQDRIIGHSVCYVATGSAPYGSLWWTLCSNLRDRP